MPVSDVDLTAASTADLTAESLPEAISEAAVELAPSEGRAPVARWYAVQVASSCEKKVKA
ncbi:MAG: transcription termination/antitermination protein NusG, partial [Synechococcaceae bacterium WBB_10_009]|nr:transcription termination/antitermination protein NusG [Synechococcaceae bacterium WBB_10_009]